ncbi:MAG: nucleoside recognition domain-containing protein [Bacilli bacterium]
MSGKSLIPFIVGSGCSVPGIMTARTVEDEDERRITIMCTPFIPCSAKLPIIVLFAGEIVGKNTSTFSKGLIAASLYFLAIIVILISATVMKKFFFKGSPTSFISELPEYKLPSIKYVSITLQNVPKKFNYKRNLQYVYY